MNVALLEEVVGKLMQNKPLQIFLLKIVITLIWLNPLIVKDTYKSIPRLFKKFYPTLS